VNLGTRLAAAGRAYKDEIRQLPDLIKSSQLDQFSFNSFGICEPKSRLRDDIFVGPGVNPGNK